MHRRIACVALTDMRVELAQERASSKSPLVVIVARIGSAVKTERDVLGNTRIDFVSREARRFGVYKGQTVAAARAKCTDLCVRVVPDSTVQTTLSRIAEAALAFGPTTGFDITQDVVWVDVGGCANLHGSEANLVRTLGASVRALGHACRVALADGPRIAAAVARFSKRESLVVPEGQGAIAVRMLPVAALELDEDVSEWLTNLGLRLCGDLQRLPRRALGLRLGERVHDIMQLLDGCDPTPLDAWRPPEVPEERVELEWGAHSIESLAFVLKTLCDKLAARLYGRALAAARLEIVLALDRALLCESLTGDHAPQEPGTCPHRLVLPIVLPSPIARASDLFAVVRARLDGCLLAAPALAVTLRATELARVSARTLDLLAPEPKAYTALPRLVAELAADFGEGLVGTLELVDTWSPFERTRLIPFEGWPLDHAKAADTSAAPEVAWSRPGDLSASFPGRARVTSALEPSRLVRTTPMPHAVLVGAQHLARTEEVEWWRRPAKKPFDDRQHCDLFAAWLGDAVGWLEFRHGRDRCGPASNEPLLRGWMD